MPITRKEGEDHYSILRLGVGRLRRCLPAASALALLLAAFFTGRADQRQIMSL